MNIVELDSQPQVFTRFLVAIALATVVTGGLMFIMERLIYTDKIVIDEGEIYTPIDIVLIEKVQETKYDIEFEEFAPPEEIPDLPDFDPIEIDHDMEQTSLAAFSAPAPNNTEVFVGGLESMPIAQATLAPQYPPRALVKGLEGYVDVMFDVTVYGATENVRVVTAQPPKVFDKAAVRAVKRWKFNPHMINGKATRYSDMVHRINFQLEK